MPVTGYEISVDQSGIATMVHALRRSVPIVPWVVPPNQYATYRLTDATQIQLAPREERRALTRDEQHILAAALRRGSELLYEF